MADTFTVDLDSLTIAEVEELEDLTDSPFDQLFGEGAKKGKVLRALAYITKKRDNPDFTWEDAGALRIELAGGDEDPTEAGAR